MSRFYQPLPFSVAYDFVAAKPVTLNGQALNPGDPVDKVGLNPRRLRQLYEARIISPVAPPELTPALLRPSPKQAPEPAPTAPEPTQALDEDEPDPEPQPDESVAAEALTGAPDGKRVEHRGFGRYFVLDADGNDLAGPLSKAAATNLAME